MRWFLVILLVGCGHTMKVGAGPLVDSSGKPGIETSFEIGKHLIGAKEVAMPVGLRLEASATLDTVQGVIGLAYGGTLPPGGRQSVPVDSTETRRGWGGRLSTAGGLAVDDDGAALAARAGIAVTRGAMRSGGYAHSGCTAGEKTGFCYGWRDWSFVHTGIEIATAFTFVGDEQDETGKLHMRGWRASAEVIYERATVSDLQLH
jgi:hypothetical protein